MFKFCFFFLFPCLAIAQFHLTNGYRHDDLYRTNTLGRQTDRLHASAINLWQVGVNGSLGCPLFLSGFAYWGIGGCSGHLKEQISNGKDAQQGRAKLQNASTSDYQISLGYLFERRCWNLSLSGGYAYDRQKIQTKRGEISFPYPAPFQNAPIYGSGYKTTTTWKGPFAGAELHFLRSRWRSGIGYEFHFASYAADHTIPQNATAQLQGFANQTKSRAYGNVVFLEGHYRFCHGLDLGLFFKYQNWTACQGALRSSYFFANRYPRHNAYGGGRWVSYQISFDIGYSF